MWFIKPGDELELMPMITCTHRDGSIWEAFPDGTRGEEKKTRPGIYAGQLSSKTAGKKLAVTFQPEV